MTQRGIFITFEGGEGTGKSSQIVLLADRLRSCGIDTLVTREPGGPIRDLLVSGDADWPPKAEALLHYAARTDHLDKLIRPALESGQWVVCDRFADSTMAYQGIVQGAGEAFVQGLYQQTVGVDGPVLTLVLDIAPELGLQRAQNRGTLEDRYERMGLAFHQKLRDAFLRIARENADRCVVIDTDRSIDAVHDDIWMIVAERFGLSA